MNDEKMLIESVNCFNQLREHFNSNIKLKEKYTGDNPLGIEIEVKWRYYFPELYEKYLKKTSYNNLSQEQKDKLTTECTALEKTLIPKLEKTVVCGIPKGLDKYYEFALLPSKNIELITGQVDILKEQQLLPTGEHSLHITVGNMKITKDTYYLLMLLELLTVNENRIKAGFNKDNPSLSAAWARKGLGGLFEKDSKELQHNYSVATEFRTLCLTDDVDVYKILKITSQISDIIIDKQQNKYNEKLEAWNSFVRNSQYLLISLGLADKNWRKPNLEPEYWNNYIKHFSTLKQKIPVIFNQYFSEQQATKVFINTHKKQTRYTF